MSLITRLFHALQSWRRRPGGPKTNRRAGVSMEQLDHRQLLAVNFTGILATDFPASMSPGVVILPNNPDVQHPTIAPAIQDIVKVSGFDINALRVTYDSVGDTLNIGFEQPGNDPANPNSPPVVAGDADNNGDDGTVNPALTATPGFEQFKDGIQFAQSETMGAFLDLNGSGSADIVAGYAEDDPRAPKEYLVADAIVNPAQPNTRPAFGAELPAYEGNVYKNNSGKHPALEIAIADFSKLYLAETGKTLTPDTVVKIGAFGGSQADLGIGEAYFPAQSVRIGDATQVTNPPCPPASPPIIVNYHQNNHINTAHDTLVRASVFGSSGFNVDQINPTTVRLGGAAPVFGFDRYINRDGYPDATFVFRGTDINLPSGKTDATLSGDLNNGSSFSSTVKVFNRDSSFYLPSQVQNQLARQTARQTQQDVFVVLPPGSPIAASSLPAGPLAMGAMATPTPSTMHAPAAATVTLPGLSPAGAAPLNVSYETPQAATTTPKPSELRGPVVSIPRSNPDSGQTPKVSLKAQASLSRFVRDAGAVDLGTGQPVGQSMAV